MSAVLERWSLTRFTLPPTRPIGDWRSEIEVRSVAVLELKTSSGAVGLGFFGAIYGPLPSLAELERRFEAAVAPGIVGQNPFALTYRVERPRGRHDGRTIFDEAVDHALWDLQGKELGLPLHRLLGGVDGRVRAYASGLDYPLATEDACAFFAGAVADGFRAVKAKVGFPDLGYELERLEAIAAAVGPGVTLMLDANEAWSPKEAVRRLHAYRDRGLDVYWIEDPCLRSDLDGLAEVSRAVPFAHVNAGEYLELDGLRALLERRAVDILNTHTDFSSSLAAARLAAAYGIPLSMGNSLADVCVHAAAALPECDWLELSCLDYGRLVDEPVRVEDGFAVAAERPGHGLTLADRALSEYVDAGA